MDELIGMVILMAGVAAWFVYRARQQTERMQTLLERGEMASAYVTELKRDHSSRSRFKHYVAYKFTARNGQTHTNRNLVTPADFKSYTERQRIEVVYDPDNPAVSMLKPTVDEARRTLGRAGTK
ncbi:MAG: DUF3592 domain-containing protein [Pseudomonadota bacterium]